MRNPFAGKHGPLMIAEIGGNHEGDFEVAKRLASLAIASNVDLVKFQIYTGDTLVSAVASPTRNQHFKKFELSREQHRYLASMVVEAGLQYTASVWDVNAIDWIDEFIAIYKIGSGDLTAYPLLRAVANRNKPIILSTGLSTETEILDSVRYIQSINSQFKDPRMFGLLQCTSMYPIPASAANLEVMRRLKEATGLTVGYSDHTEGPKALQYAVAMGAEILEFHFTDGRQGKEFRDHKVSLTKEEVHELILEIELIASLRGTSVKKPEPIEIENGHVLSFRRAIYAASNIGEGEVLTAANTTVLRPNEGIDAREYDRVIGKKAKTSIAVHQPITWDLLDL